MICVMSQLFTIFFTDELPVLKMISPIKFSFKLNFVCIQLMFIILCRDC